MSVFVVMWEIVSGLEKGAGAFESWRGRAEDLGTVIDIGNRKKWVDEVTTSDQGHQMEKDMVRQ